MASFGLGNASSSGTMSNSESIRQSTITDKTVKDDFPANTHVVFSARANTLNRALLDGFLKHQHDAGIRRSHLFNGRYENIYLTTEQVPELKHLLDEACDHASRIVGIDDLRAGCWFNYMPPGAVTTVHSHDDDDELLSAVYYVSVAESSGKLIIHHGNNQHSITPEQGMFVFFAPDVVHEVSKNLSNHGRLSIAINFGRRKVASE